jgi:hypothetical protein
VWFGKCEAFSLFFLPFCSGQIRSGIGPNASVASWFSVLRKKISGICLWLTLAAGLGFGMLSRLDTPALQVIVRNASLSVVLRSVLTYFPKKRNFGDVFP